MLTQPKPPEPSEFGLTTASIVGLPKTLFVHFFDDFGKQHNRFAVFAVSWGVLVSLSTFYLGKAGIGIAIPLVFPLLGLIFIAGHLERLLRSLLSANYRRNEVFQKACTRYKTELSAYNAWLWKQKEEFWRALSGSEFEAELGQLFRRAGYDVDWTPVTADGGVDLLLKRDGRLTVVQCKAHKTRVPIGVVRELYASKMDFKAHDAIIASLDGLTRPAEEYIRERSITSLTLSDIIEIQSKHSHVKYGDEAERGNAEAQFYLGEAYNDGDGVAQSDEDAVKWWRKAAEQGHSAAQYQLACAYWEGLGVSKNFVAAHMWFSLSWDENVLLPPRVFYSPSAHEQIQELENSMSQVEISESRRLAREWSQRIGLRA